jgi:hypothetical protein
MGESTGATHHPYRTLHEHRAGSHQRIGRHVNSIMSHDFADNASHGMCWSPLVAGSGSYERSRLICCVRL